MIKVTLEFPSVEAAIASLGKLMVGAPVAQKAAASGPATAGAPVAEQAPVAAPASPTTPKSRKPRADAGKKRGPHNADSAGTSTGEAPKGDAAPASPSGSAPETAAPVAPAEGDKPQPSGVTPPAAAAPSEADAQAALEKVFAGKGLQAAQATLAQFGVTRLRDIKPEDRAQFIAAAEKAAA